MKGLPVGIQDFREIRNGDYVYVDKTPYIYDLIEKGKYYFLSRPRRFGKSLLISTLKELFEGNQELFEGLWIENKIDWEKHPVIHISFNAIGYRDIGLKAAIKRELDFIATKFGIKLIQEGISARFRELLEKLSQINKVVLLIDEYDKPIIDFLDDIPKAQAQRDILKNFYSIIKNSDIYIRFLLITGVSKFSKVSVFSDLNNLADITMAPVFDAIAGYTQAELEENFQAHIAALSRKLQISTGQLLNQIKEWYNGYSWGGSHRLYNPFSVLSLFLQQRFGNFWFQTGTPTFLIKVLKEGMHFDLENLAVGETLFESYDLQNLEHRALLFQTGYLSIQEVDEDGIYILGFPNREVRDAMYQHLLGGFRHASPLDTQPLLVNMKRSLEARDPELFISHVNTLFASIPYQIFIQDQESFFHAVLHITFRAMGMYAQSEVSRSIGRIDTIVQTKHYVYIMEFKLDGSSEAALDQIRTKGYGRSYLDQDKTVIALGVNFSSQRKAVADWRAVDDKELLTEG